MGLTFHATYMRTDQAKRLKEMGRKDARKELVTGLLLDNAILREAVYSASRARAA